MRSAPENYSLLRRYLLVFSSFICCVCTAGVIFGFTSLKAVLEDAGVYHELCDHEGPCSAQSARLMLMFTFASSSTNIAAIFIGYILDKYGPRISMVCGSVLFSLACLLFALAFTLNVDMYIIAYVLLALGGPFIFLSTLHLSCALPHLSNFVMAALTCGFDISSAVFLIFNKLYFGTDGKVGVPEFFLGYMAIPIFALLVAVFLMPDQSFTLETTFINRDEGEVSTSLLKQEEEEESLENIDGKEEELIDSIFDLKQASLMDQLKSFEFIFLVIFMCLYMLRFNFFIQSLNDYLGAITHQNATTPLFVFGIMLPVGPLAAMLLTTWLLRHSFSMIYWFLIAMNVLFSVLNLTPNMSSQYGSFVFFVLMRSMLYTFANQFCGKTFGFKNFGLVYGILMIISGTFNFFEYLFTYLTLNIWKGDYFNANLILSIVSIVVGSIFPVYLYKKSL